jgi:hypothetical protein
MLHYWILGGAHHIPNPTLSRAFPDVIRTKRKGSRCVVDEEFNKITDLLKFSVSRTRQKVIGYCRLKAVSIH